MRLAEQVIEYAQAAEKGVDVAVIRDVVTEIGHWRRIDRRYPNGVDAQPDEMIEAIDDAFQVADAIAVAVLEGARIDLIDDPRLPPRRYSPHDTSSIIPCYTPRRPPFPAPPGCRTCPWR